MVDRLRAVGLPLIAALLALAGGLWAFGLIVDEQIREGDTGMDDRLAAWLHDHATPGWTTFFENVTVLGNFTTLLAITIVAVALLWRRQDRVDAVFVLFAFVGAQVLSSGMKAGFKRDRPFFPDPLATESSFSFPSGHALISLAVYGSIALVIARRLPSTRQRVVLLGATGVLVLLIGFSRLYLGVHFLSDVLAGYAAGLAWLALLYVMIELKGRYTSRYRASAQQ